MSKRSCVKSRAFFDYDNNRRKHRYLLERIWGNDEKKGMAAIIMFNPSCADELKYDKTSMNVVNYLIDKDKYNGVYILNLYSIIETNGEKVTGDLKKVRKARNNRFMKIALKNSKDVFVAWGSDKDNARRITEVKNMIKNSGHNDIYQLLDKDGIPKHPSICTIVSDNKVSL